MSVGLATAPAIDLTAARSVLRPVLARTRLGRAFVEGRLTDAQARRLAERLILDGRKEFRGLTRLLADRTLTLDRWHDELRDAVAARHAAATLALLGGGPPDSAALADLGRRLDGQLAYLARFAAQVRTGIQPLDGTAPARAELYADAAWATAQEVRRGSERRSGATEERASLGAADHCGSCVERASLGWQPAGTLLPIGQGICLSRCHCSLDFR